jgi:predicted ATPase
LGAVGVAAITLDGLAPIGRWRPLETLRAYPLEKLAESGETEQAARRCTEFFRDLVVPAMHGSSVLCTVEDMARYGREIDNVRPALGWSFCPVGYVAIGVALTAVLNRLVNSAPTSP